jgi:hypothetical protein
MAQYVLNLVFGIREGTLDVESKAIMQALMSGVVINPSPDLTSLVMKRTWTIDFHSTTLKEAGAWAKGVAEKLDGIPGGYSAVIHDLYWSLKRKMGRKILAQGSILAETTSFVDGGRIKSPSTS